MEAVALDRIALAGAGADDVGTEMPETIAAGMAMTGAGAASLAVGSMVMVMAAGIASSVMPAAGIEEAAHSSDFSPWSA